MIAAASRAVMRALLDHAAARPALRRQLKSLVRGVPLLQRLVSTWAGVAQSDMVAAATGSTPVHASGGPSPGFSDRERLLATARTIIARDRSDAASLPAGREGPG